jgi:capsular exopolysaccharide synthesis family protein
MNNLEENQLNIHNTPEQSIDYKQFVAKYISMWRWSLLSIFVCLSIAYVYGRYATEMYTVSARVLVNDKEKGGALAGASDMLSGGFGSLLGNKNSVDNEAEIMKTKFLAEHVVNDLQLNIKYFMEGRVKRSEIYTPPFMVRTINLKEKAVPALVKVKFLEGDRIALRTKGLDTVVSFNKSIQIPKLGTVEILKNKLAPDVHSEYSFHIQSVGAEIDELLKSLKVSIGNKTVTIIDLNINTAIPKKGTDILNRIIYNYVQENLKDKNEIADSTIAFIRRRLMVITNELGEAESNIEGFKQRNNLADMSEQGKLLVATSGQYVSDLAKVETQISIVKSLMNFLKDDTNNKRVLPSTLIPTDLVFSGIIEKYNALLLERGRKLIGLTPTNPIIVNLDRQIESSRADIESNLTSTLNGYLVTRNELAKQVAGTEGEIKRVPATERNYLQLARQQQIKQELYIFLMQKSEETAISKTANLANSRTIDPPRAEIKPYAPKKSFIYAFSLFTGLLIPVIVLFAKDLLNDKVETKDDITKRTSVPVVGEIIHLPGNDVLAVSHNSRSAIAEQFRALRTNLSFFLTTPEEKVILMTSSMSGEGKSFITINFGNIMAISGKKVLLMELDLRKPGLSTKLGIANGTGFTNYVLSQDLSAKDIVKPLNLHPNLFMVSSGPLPPNPAEVLMSPRTGELIEELKAQFDYIIVDAPPVGIITDAQLLSKHADMCLYLVRQHYTSKVQLSIVQDLQQSRKMKKLGIVVNGIKVTKGYGYGAGYGTYGDYGQEQKAGFFKKLFNR